jgi:outer membrane lipoprotein-sorting protein
MKVRGLHGILCLGTAVVLAGCASRTRRVSAPAGIPKPALKASKQELVRRYDEQAATIRSLNAAVKLKAETGSAFAGVIKEYRQIDAFLLAERPAYIRVVGQAPVVGTDIFDMVSDGKTFHMYIPSKRKFLVGPARLEKVAEKSIENLRPQPIYDALIWPKITADEPATIEEENREQPPVRYYVLSVLRHEGTGLAMGRRIWFDRSDLRVSRLEIFGPGGRLESDVRYTGWNEQAGQAAFPGRIVLSRPHEDYRLEIGIKRVKLNEKIPADRFELKQPAGTERVEVGNGGGTR